MKISIQIDVEIKDNRFHYNILAPKDLSLKDIRSIVTGGVALSIRGEKTPQGQGVALREIINYLEQEFINVDSFTDTRIFTKEQDPPSE